MAGYPPDSKNDRVYDVSEAVNRLVSDAVRARRVAVVSLNEYSAICAVVSPDARVAPLAIVMLETVIVRVGVKNTARTYPLVTGIAALYASPLGYISTALEGVLKLAAIVA